MSLLGSNLMWLVIILGIIFAIIIFFYIMRKLKKYDPFLEQFMLKKNQCKMFKEDNIGKVYIENGKDGLMPMGKYEGECVDKEGYHNILFSRVKFGLIGRWLKRILFFASPLLDLLLKKFWIIRSNVNPIFEDKVESKDPITGQTTITTNTITLPSVKVVKGNGVLILHCYGLQMKKYFTYPILQNQDGTIIQDEAINFVRERDSVLNDVLYEQSVMGDTEIVIFRDGVIDVRKIEDFKKDDCDFMIQCFNPKDNSVVLRRPSSFQKHVAHKDGYEITTSYNNKIRLTGDHSVFTWKPKTAGITTEEGSIVKSEVRNLKKGGWIVIPNAMKVIEKDMKHFDLVDCKNHKHIYKLNNKKTIALTDDILWALGMFASEGWFDKNTVHFSTDADNVEMLTELFKARFGLEGKFMHYIYKRKDGSKVRIVRLSFHSAVVADMFRILTKDRNWVLQLPLRRLKFYLHGLWCGDGWHNGKYAKLRQTEISTSDMNDAEFIRKIFLRFGVLAGIYTQIYSGKEHLYWGLHMKNDGKYVTYHVTASGIDQPDILEWDDGFIQFQKFKKIGDLTLAKINSIKKFRIDGYVYDFSMPHCENFIGNNVCCHNTIDFANVMREAVNLNPSLRYLVKTEGKALPEGGG